MPNKIYAQFRCELGGDEEEIAAAAVHVAFSSGLHSIHSGVGLFGACMALSAPVGLGNAPSR